MREKMKISAIICELNPLGGLVCVLSGNFVQRGEPALLDKWSRTRLALESGADLVLELPLPWALAGAERFAAGGVALARALGCVDTLLFGSEEGDIQPLWQLAERKGTSSPCGSWRKPCSPRRSPRRSNRWTPPSPLPSGGSGRRPAWWGRTLPPCWKSPTAFWGWST